MNEPTNTHLLNAILGLKEDLGEVKMNVAKVKAMVDGGSEPDRGLVMRLKLAERDIADAQAEHRTVKNAAWVAVAGALTAAGATLWERLNGRS